MTLLDASWPPASQPLLGFLMGGFLIMVAGLVLLTVRPVVVPFVSAAATRRALLYALVFTLCAASFGRLLSPALLGRETSPWLLALGDVVFVTLGLFVWVMVLAEGHDWSRYGFHGTTPTRWALTLGMGLGVALVYAARPYFGLISRTHHPDTDTVVFALVAASVGSTIPEEILFRGYLQGSLTGRVRRWGAIALPAVVFAVQRSLRFLPGVDLDLGEWLSYVFRVALPLGLWWGLMRDLAGGSLWPVLASRFVLQFGSVLAGSLPGASIHGP
jgi:membrane protease YdiL (CAAX protease family)